MHRTGRSHLHRIGLLKTWRLINSSLSTKARYLEIIKENYILTSRWQLPCANHLAQSLLMAPLHEAVLLGSLESVNEWIPLSDKTERNFLGQTPIHLAISNLRHLL